MDFLFVFKLLLEKKWYLVLIPIASAVLSFVLTIGMKREYKSTAKLATRFTTEDRITVTNDRSNLRDADVKFNNLVEMMNSELMVSMVSYRLVLRDFNSPQPFRVPSNTDEREWFSAPTHKAELIKILQSKIDRFELLSNNDPTEKKILNLLADYGYVNWLLVKNLKVMRAEGSDFVDATYTSEDPFLSSLIANTLCEEMIRYDNFLNSKRAEQSVTFFANLVEEKKKLLEEKTSQLSAYKESAGTAHGSAGTATIITSQESKRAELQSTIKRLRLTIDNLNKRIQAVPTAQQKLAINTEIVRLKKRMDDLNAGPQNDAVRQEVKALQSQLQLQLTLLEEARTPGKPKGELETEREEKEVELNVAESELRGLESSLYSMRRSSSGETVYDALQKQVDKASEDLVSATERYNIERSKAMIASPLQIAIKALPNNRPEFSKRILVVGISGVASFLICVFLIIFAEYLNPRMRTPDQLRGLTGLRLLGAVNKIDAKNLKLTDLFASQRVRHLDEFKQGLRKLRHEIEESKSQVLLVTSTRPNQGKTFLILCLSFTLAVLKKKVLIIDTNFPHNSLSQVLKKKGSKKAPKETSELEVPPSHNVMVYTYPNTFAQSVTLGSSNQYINIVGNSRVASSPSEIFADKDFNNAIDSLRKYYDYIIMEGPSLNEFADTKELVNYADSVIAVFNANTALNSVDRESIEYLKALNGKLMGAILNQVDVKEMKS